MHDLEAIDYVNRLVTAEVARERERCALLCESVSQHGLAAAIRRGVELRGVSDDTAKKVG